MLYYRCSEDVVMKGNLKPQFSWMVLIGVEGSGKSTLVRLLLSLPENFRAYLLGANIVFDATYSDHLLAYLFQKFLVSLGKREIHLYPDGSKIFEPDYCVIARLFPLWYMLQLVSFFIYSLKNMLRALAGSLVIWERGAYSFLSYIATMELYLRLRGLREDKCYPYTLFTARLFHGLLRKIPHVVIYLNCDFNVIRRRQLHRKTPVIPSWIVLFRALVEKALLKKYFTFAPLIEIDTTGLSPTETLVEAIKKLKR